MLIMNHPWEYPCCFDQEGGYQNNLQKYFAEPGQLQKWTPEVGCHKLGGQEQTKHRPYWKQEQELDYLALENQS